MYIKQVARPRPAPVNIEKNITYEVEEKDKNSTVVVQEKKAIFRAYQIIWYILGIVETLLLFRFVLKFFAANPLSPFVILVYTFTGVLVFPFWAIFPQVAVAGSVFDWSALVAMVVYFVVAYWIIHFLQVVKPVSKKEIENIVDKPYGGDD